MSRRSRPTAKAGPFREVKWKPFGKRNLRRASIAEGTITQENIRGLAPHRGLREIQR